MSIRIIRGLIFALYFSVISSGVFASEVEITAQDLDNKWDFYGDGVKKLEHGMLYMKEDKNSRGVMIVSPEIYGDRVVLRYEIMALNATTVCMAIMAASDVNSEGELNIPYKYDGGLKIWKHKLKNYFFEFNNAIYNSKPLLMKYPDNKQLAIAEENCFKQGEFNIVEIGRRRDRFWLMINGKEIFRINDDHEYEDGKIAIRIQGLFDERAACLIRGVTVEAR